MGFDKETAAKAMETRLRNLEERNRQEAELRAQGIEPDLDKRPSAGSKFDTPMTAIRAMCLDCVCGSYKEVELCTAPDCPLWAYRFGMRPETAAAQGKQVDREAYKAGGAAHAVQVQA